MRPTRVLLTAFEPSGDEHAAAVVQALRQSMPDVELVGTGGRHMAEAGVQMLEQTVGVGVMGVTAIKQIQAHRQRVARLGVWLKDHPIDMLVPVDSPAANWSICDLVRKTQPNARIVHLVAPQLWAWGAWRIKKLRRLTDHVLCLLPFEPDWFAKRGVSATFVGHPQFDPNRTMDMGTGELPEGELKLALLPGSRRHEIEFHWPMMVQMLADLQKTRPGLVAAAPAVDDWARELMAELDGGRAEPPGCRVLTRGTDRILAWADVVLVASGTATLQVARSQKPMVAVYNVANFWWYIQSAVHLMFEVGTYALPNLISEHLTGERAVPEFIPHWADPKPIMAALTPLLDDPAAREAQRARLSQICDAFGDQPYGQNAAAEIQRQLAMVRR